MKWLRSSLFKNNNDIFVFKEKVDMDFTTYDSSLENVENIEIFGKLTRSGRDKIYIDLNISGIYKIVSSRTLEVISVPFEISEEEEFIDKSLINELDLETNVMDLYINIEPLVRELVIINIPISSYLESEKLENTKGNGWEFLSDEDYSRNVEEKPSPFATLNNMFKE